MTSPRTAGVSPALTAKSKKSGRDARGPTTALHKQWHSRGYLPHCDVPGLIQSVTFRLADALPAAVLEGWKLEAGNDSELHTKIDAFLDAGHGACWLKQPAIADLVEDTLLHGDGTRYHLLAWCVMPNHVHVLFEIRGASSLSAVLQAWKSFSAKAINQHLGRSGSVWMPDYFDRYIRDDHHLAAVIEYIHTNPVKAGLVQHASEWVQSSTHRTAGVPPAGGRDARAPIKA